MKVGVYFPGYIQEAGGGYIFEQDVLRSLIQISRESSHEFVLISEQHKANKLPLSNNEQLSNKLVLLPQQKPFLFRAFDRVLSKLGWKSKGGKTHSLDKVIAQEGIEFFWFLTPVHFLVEIPYIATIWDIQHRVQPWFPEVGTKNEWIGREKYFSQYIKRATYIITPNQVGQDEIAFYYQIPPERFILIPHPVPKITLLETAQVDEILHKYKLKRQGYLFYPAQLWPHKNHINLLRAVKILRDDYQISLPLVLAGADKGNLQHILSSLKEMGMNDQIHFLGFIPRYELIALYQGAFALTFLSLFGPENLPPLEAFACSCPVIVARVAGAEEQFKDAALIVNGTKPGEIAEAIQSLQTNPNLREELIKKGKIRAAEFTGIDYVREVMAALNHFETVRRNWGVEYTPHPNKLIRSK